MDMIAQAPLGVTSPVLQQSYANDPRAFLARQMVESASNQTAPLLSPYAALAKALQTGLAGATNVAVGQDYANRQKALGDTMAQALQAGQTGVAGWHNPDAGQTMQADGTPMPNAPVPDIQAQPPGFEALASVLSKNPDPAAQQMALQYGIQGMTTKQAAQIAFLQKLAEKGLTLESGTGNVIPLPNYGRAEAANVGPVAQAQAGGTATGTNAANAQPGIGGQAAVITATAPAKAAAAAQEETAKNPALISRAVGTAAGTAPIEVNKAIAIEAGTAPIKAQADLTKPTINRVTGEVEIPWFNPEIRKQFSASQHGGTTESGAAAPAIRGAIPPVSPPSPAGERPPSEEVPSVPLPTGLMPKGPGTISAGRDPIAIKAAEQAVEQANEQYKGMAAASNAASSTHAALGSMRTILQNGGVNTSATAPARATLSAYLNATFGPSVAKQVTNIDPAQADVFNKEATRMGLMFARQTEGAREAVQAIKIALGANPSLSNTEEGNRKIIDLLDAGAQRDMDAQKYGDAYFAKNNHYVGFNGWFNQAHPAAEYTSKVVPYNAPRAADGSIDTSQLQPNVTYMGKAGPGIWTGSGFRPAK